MKVSEFRVNFVEVCEWFDGCDRIKIILKSRLLNCPLFERWLKFIII